MGRSPARHRSQTELGHRVRARRSELKLSQMALADRIGLHSVERGERNLSLSSLLRLAEGLEVDPAVLVKGLTWSAPLRRRRSK